MKMPFLKKEPIDTQCIMCGMWRSSPDAGDRLFIRSPVLPTISVCEPCIERNSAMAKHARAFQHASQDKPLETVQ